jgi:hypothetical protein
LKNISNSERAEVMFLNVIQQFVSLDVLGVTIGQSRKRSCRNQRPASPVRHVDQNIRPQDLRSLCWDVYASLLWLSTSPNFSQGSLINSALPSPNRRFSKLWSNKNRT